MSDVFLTIRLGLLVFGRKPKRQMIYKEKYLTDSRLLNSFSGSQKTEIEYPQNAEEKNPANLEFLLNETLFQEKNKIKSLSDKEKQRVYH